MKRKFYISVLVFAGLFLGISQINAQFAEWSYAADTIDGKIEITWNGPDWGLMDPDWKDNLKMDNKKTISVPFFEGFDMAADEVGDVWDDISSDETPLDNYIQGDERRDPVNEDDFSAKMKAFHDRDDVYVIVKVTDDEIIEDKDAIELFWASYADSLPVEDWPFTPRFTSDENEHVIARWGQRGAGKAFSAFNEIDPSIEVESNFYFKENDEGEWEHSWVAPTADSLGMSTNFLQTGNNNYEAVWRFNIEKTFDGFIAPEANVIFSFEFKVIDEDTTEQEFPIQAQFNSPINEVWWSTYYAGYAQMEGVSTNMVVPGSDNEMFVYPNPAKNVLFINEDVVEVEMFNSTGALILNKEGVQSTGGIINVSGYARGLYILKITNQKGFVDYQKVLLK